MTREQTPRYLSSVRAADPAFLFRDAPQFIAFLEAIDIMKSGELGPFNQKLGELCEEATLSELGDIMMTFRNNINDALEACVKIHGGSIQ